MCPRVSCGTVSGASLPGVLFHQHLLHKSHSPVACFPIFFSQALHGNMPANGLYHMPASAPRDSGVAQPLSEFLSALAFPHEEVCNPCACAWVPGAFVTLMLSGESAGLLSKTRGTRNPSIQRSINPLPAFALLSAISFSGSPLWALSLVRKVAAPQFTRARSLSSIALIMSAFRSCAKVACRPKPINQSIFVSPDWQSTRQRKSVLTSHSASTRSSAANSARREFTPSCSLPTL